MHRDEYERSKARLEEQRRAGVELIETAYQAQIRALDLVWMIQGEGSVAGAATAPSAAAPVTPAPEEQEPPPPVERPRRRTAPEVDADVREAFRRFPETFTHHGVCKILGYEPDRGSLYRSLRSLVRDGQTRIESRGAGHRATIYRKTGGDHSPEKA